MIIKGKRVKSNYEYRKIYGLWRNMIDRCYKPANASYKYYGAVGVEVSDRWLMFNNFVEDIDKIRGFDYNLFFQGLLTLDKDKFGNSKMYSLENCCFISKEENNKYKPNQQKIVIGTSPNGEIYEFLNQSEFAREHNLRQSTINDCLNGKCKSHKGWKFNYKNKCYNRQTAIESVA